MKIYKTTIVFIILNILLITGIVLILFPLKKILKLVFNTLIGAAIIYIINLIGASFGFHIGLNIITALVVGILGIPGAILLIILEFIM